MSKLLVVYQVFLTFLFFAVVTCGPAIRKKCIERADDCTSGLVTADMSADLEVICREFRSYIDCMNKLMDDCLGGIRIPIFNPFFEEIEEYLRTNCKRHVAPMKKNGTDKEMEEIEKCLQQYEDYIDECKFDGYQDNESDILGNEDVDEDILICAKYRRYAGCAVDRIREKCGDNAALISDMEFSDPPKGIAEACRTAEDY